MKVKSTQSCPTLCNPMDYTYSPLNSPGQHTGVGNPSLLQGIFPTQGWHPGLPCGRCILYQLSYHGSPRGTIHLSNTIECMTPSANFKVKHELWVIMMHQCRFINYNKCNTLVRDINNWGDCASVGLGGNKKSLYPPLNFAVNQKAFLCFTGGSDGKESAVWEIQVQFLG